MKMWIRTGSIVLLVAVFLMAMTGAVHAEEQRIQIQIDRQVVRVGDSLQLNVAMQGGGMSNPDLRGIDNFDIVGTSSGSSFQLINGTITRSANYVYQLNALRAGQTDIYAEAQAGRKKIRSNTIQVTVIDKAAAAAPSQQPPADAPKDVDGKNEIVFLWPKVSSKNPVVGSQVTVDYYIYVREGIRPSNFNLTELPEFTGFVAHELSTSSQLTFSMESVNGQNYMVALVKRWAVFPLSVGEATIGSLGLNLTVPRRRGRRSMDPFGDFDAFFGRGESVQLQSDPFRINVQPLPGEGKPAGFSGAVGDFSVVAQLDNQQVQVGQPLELSIVVSGDGNVDSVARPQLQLDDRLRVFSEQAEPAVVAGFDKVSGEKKFQLVLIASEPGEYEIPPVRVPFFNPATGKYDVAVSEPLKFSATGEAIAEATPAMGVISRESIELRGRDLRYLRPDKKTLRPAGKTLVEIPAFWILLGVWPFVVLGIAIYQVRAGRLRADRRSWRSRRAMKEAQRRLSETKKLAAGSDAAMFYSELMRAVLGFIADKLDAAAPGLERGELLEHLRTKQVDEQAVATLDRLWRDADGVRFGGQQADTADRKAAYERARDLLADLSRGLEQ